MPSSTGVVSGSEVTAGTVLELQTLHGQVVVEEETSEMEAVLETPFSAAVTVAV